MVKRFVAKTVNIILCYVFDFNLGIELVSRIMEIHRYRYCILKFWYCDNPTTKQNPHLISMTSCVRNQSSQGNIKSNVSVQWWMTDIHSDGNRCRSACRGSFLPAAVTLSTLESVLICLLYINKGELCSDWNTRCSQYWSPLTSRTSHLQHVIFWWSYICFSFI